MLAATFHDPDAALLADVRRFLPRLAALYDGIAVATSPPTAAPVNALLATAGAYAGTPSTNARGPLYRLALRAALAHAPTRVHYLDFDRALHWLRRAPRELPAVLRAARRHDVLLLGRTARAHRSHHRALHATETVVNLLFAERLRARGRVDFLVPSFVLPVPAVRRLLARSRARDARVYGEWAALLAGADARLAYLECDGLDWETPDRAPRVAKGTWRRRLDTPVEWRARTEMAAEIIEGFTRTLRRHPAQPVLVRVARRACASGR